MYKVLDSVNFNALITPINPSIRKGTLETTFQKLGILNTVFESQKLW